jgi:H+/Cl- antiporter ClcA
MTHVSRPGGTERVHLLQPGAQHAIVEEGEGVERRRRGSLPSTWALVATVELTSSARAEPYIATTANRAVALAPWPVWWLGILVVSFGLLSPLTRALLRRSGVRDRRWLRGAWLLAFVHAATGVLTLSLMALMSIGYETTHPFFFVAAWLVLSCAIVVAYTVVAARITARRLRGNAAHGSPA